MHVHKYSKNYHADVTPITFQDFHEDVLSVIINSLFIATKIDFKSAYALLQTSKSMHQVMHRSICLFSPLFLAENIFRNIEEVMIRTLKIQMPVVKLPVRRVLFLQDSDQDKLLADNNRKITNYYFLCQAVKENNLVVLKILLDDYRFDPSDCSQYLLDLAIEMKNESAFKYLLDDPRININFKQGYALFKAIESQTSRFVEIILNHPKFDLSSTVKEYLLNSLLQKTLFFRNNILTILVNYKAIKINDELLHRAISDSNLPLVILLLENYPFDLRANNYEALTVANGPLEGKRNTSILALLLKNLTKEIKATDYYSVIKYLVTNVDYDPNLLDNYQNNELMYAINLKEQEAVKLLLDHFKVDPNQINSKALRIAISIQSDEIVKILLDHPKVNFQNNFQDIYKMVESQENPKIKALFNL